MSGAPMDTGSGSSGAGHGSAPPTSLDHDSDSSSLSDVDNDEVLELLRKEVDEYTKRQSAADNEILMDDMLNIPTASADPTYSSNTSIFGRYLGPRTQGNIFGPSSTPSMQPIVPSTFSFGPSVAPTFGPPPAPSVQPDTPSNNSSASQGNINMFGRSLGPKDIFGTLPPPPTQPNPSQHAIPGLFQDSASTTRGSLFSSLPSVPVGPGTSLQPLPGLHLNPYPTGPFDFSMVENPGNTPAGSDPWLLAGDLEIGHLWNEGHPVNQRPVIQPKSVSRKLPEGTNNPPKITGRLASFIATAGHGSASGTAMTGQMRSSSSENPHSIEICDPVHRPSPEEVTSHQHGRSQSPTTEKRDLSMHPPIRRQPPTGAAAIDVQPLTDNPHLECDQRLAAAMRDVSEMREREKELLNTQLNDMEIEKKKQREDLEELLRRRSSDLRKQHAKDIQELKKELTRKDMVLQSAAAKAHKEGSDAAVRDHAHRYHSMDEALRKREDIVKKKEASEASVVQATRDAIAKKEKELTYKESSLRMREEDLQSARKSFNSQCDALMAEKEQELENLTKISETQQTAARELLATQDAAQKAISERDEKLRSLNTQLVQAQNKLSAAEAKQQQVENQLNVFKAQSYKLMAGRDQELKKLNAELADTRRQLSVTKAQQQEQNNNENSVFKSQFDKAIADREEELKNMKAQLLNTQTLASDEIANKDKALSELNAHISHINESSQKAIADRDETLRNLNAQLANIQLAVPDAIANKDRALNELNAQLSKLQESSQKEIADRDDALKNLSAQLTKIQTAMPDAIAEKDEALSELRTQLSNLHATSQKTIADRDETLKNMNAQLANIQTAAPDSTVEKDEEVKDLNAQLTILQESSQKEIADRDEMLKNLSAQLTEIQTAMPDAIAEKDKALSELKTQLSNLHATSQKTIADRDETLKNMNAQLANIQTAAPDSIAEKDKELKDLNAQLTNLQATSQKAIADREEEVKELKKQLLNAQATESSPGAEKDKALDELNAQLSSLQVTSQKAIADRDEQINKLTGDLISIVKEDNEKLEEAIAQKENLHAISLKAIAQRDDLLKTLNSLHAEIVAISEKRITGLAQKVADLNKAYEDLDARHARLQKLNKRTVANRDATFDALLKLKSQLATSQETAQKVTVGNDKDLLEPSSQLSDNQLATQTATPDRDEESKNLNAQTVRSQETAQKATVGNDQDLLKLSSQLSDIQLATQTAIPDRDEESKNLNAQTLSFQETAQKEVTAKTEGLRLLSLQVSNPQSVVPNIPTEKSEESEKSNTEISSTLVQHQNLHEKSSGAQPEHSLYQLLLPHCQAQISDYQAQLSDHQARLSIENAVISANLKPLAEKSSVDQDDQSREDTFKERLLKATKSELLTFYSQQFEELLTLKMKHSAELKSQAEIISSQIQEASAYKKMCDDQASQFRNETLEYKKKCDDDVHNQLQEQASAYQKKYDDDFRKLKEEASATEQKCNNDADHQLQEQASTYQENRDEDVRQQVESQMKTAKSQFEAEKATYCAQIEKIAQEKWEKIHMDANENYHAILEKKLDKELKLLEEGLKKQASDSAPKDGEERKRLHQQLKDISRKANQLQGDFDRESSRHQVTMDDLVDVRQRKRRLELRLAFSEKEVSRLLQEIAGHEKAATENSQAWHEENMRLLLEHTQSARESKEAREEASLAHGAAEEAEKAKEAAIKSLRRIKWSNISLQRQLDTLRSKPKADDGRSDTLKGLTVEAGDLLVKEVDLLAPGKGGLNKKKRGAGEGKHKSSQDKLGQIKKGPLASQRDWLRAHPHWQFLLVLLFMTGLLYCIGAGISCLVSWSGAGQEEMWPEGIWPEEARHFDLRGGGRSGVVGWMWEDPLLDLSRKGILR